MTPVLFGETSRARASLHEASSLSEANDVSKTKTLDEARSVGSQVLWMRPAQ